MNISKEKNMNIEELEAVVGGVCNKDTTFLLYMGGRGICKDCGFEKLM